MIEIWNKELSHIDYEITNDGQIAMLNSSSYKTIYGDQVIKYVANFGWNVKILEADKPITSVLGLIPNDSERMEECKNESSWYKLENNYKCSGYALGCSGGYFGVDSCCRYYCDSNIFTKQGDVLELRLNWHESSLHYIINGKDLGNALQNKDGNMNKITDKNAEFRVAFCMYGANAKIMIEGHYL